MPLRRTCYVVEQQVRDGVERFSVRKVIFDQFAVASAMASRLNEDLGTGERNQCHENAERFVRLRPGSEVVECWMIETDRLFGKHSIVLHNGRLIEVTSLDGERQIVLHRAEYRAFATLPGQIMRRDAAMEGLSPSDFAPTEELDVGSVSETLPRSLPRQLPVAHDL
jgi:hypothetical protein